MTGKYSRTVISSARVAKSKSPLSEGVIHGNMIYLSGQLGRNPQTGELENSFEKQAERVLDNIQKILEDAGSSMEMVLKTTIFVVDPQKVAILNPIYRKFFSEPYPARSCVTVAALGQNAEIEIEAIAVIPKC